MSASEDISDENEYKEQAEYFKNLGNESFRSGDIEKAITHFTQAIDIDPDNHVLYSNRSAAYMRLDHKSKSLYDAEKCVELAPTWAKGYNRLGIAQQSLRRFDLALQSFKKSIEIEPSNADYWQALQACELLFEADKEKRFKEAKKERELEEERQRMKDEALKNIRKPQSSTEPETNRASEDELLASFFSEISEVKKEVAKPPQEEEKDDTPILTEKYVNQDLGTAMDQYHRILAKHYEWRNLNPYHVLDLDIDATEEDIKYRYKKLSLKVHPDRLRDVENSRDAFEQVKEAYQRLLDENQRKMIIMHIENVTDDVEKERARLIHSGVSESSLPPFEEERKRKIMKHFADLEQMKRLSEKNRRAYSMREKQQEEKVEEQNTRFAEFNKDWTEENRTEKRVGNWRDFQNDPSAKKAKAMNFKEETRDEENNKHGAVKLEEWRKKWK